MAPRLIPSHGLPARRRSAGRGGDDYGVSDVPDWRGIDWSRHLHELQIDRRAVAYADIGTGLGRPPVVFVHGLAGCWQNWIENLPRIARHRRAIALDLPGFGRSEMPRDPISITHYARAVNELCDRLALGRVVVVGNSMGGLIGADLAARFPKRVERVVLVSAAGMTHRQLLRRPARTFTRTAMFLATTTTAQHAALLARPRVRHLALSTILRHPTRLALDLLLEQTPRHGLPGFMPALEAIMTYDIRERLPEVGCPALIVQGRHDLLVPVRDADEYERLIPDARKIVWDETGHAPQLERPVRFNDALLAFVSSAGAAAAARRPHGLRQHAETA
jgi:pimeloyl-ACP methyl ester carboxylesterase